jgi:hypothetical protein
MSTNPVSEYDQRIIHEFEEGERQAAELYHGVARYLDGWNVETRPGHEAWYGTGTHYELVNATEPDKRISLNASKHLKGKVAVSGYWPRQGSYPLSPSDVGEDSPAIKVSLDRGYEAIAREISQRFVPAYHRVFDKLASKIAAGNEYQARRMANWQRLRDAGVIVNPRPVAGEVWEANTDPVADVRVRTAKGGRDYDQGYGDVRMTGEDSVEIKLRSVPIDTAIRVLKALMEAE